MSKESCSCQKSESCCPSGDTCQESRETLEDHLSNLYRLGRRADSFWQAQLGNLVRDEWRRALAGAGVGKLELISDRDLRDRIDQGRVKVVRVVTPRFVWDNYERVETKPTPGTIVANCAMPAPFATANASVYVRDDHSPAVRAANYLRTALPVLANEISHNASKTTGAVAVTHPLVDVAFDGVLGSMITTAHLVYD